MNSERDKPNDDVALPATPQGVADAARDFEQLLRDLDQLRDTGTVVEHISPETYKKRKSR